MTKSELERELGNKVAMLGISIKDECMDRCKTANYSAYLGKMGELIMLLRE